MKAFTVIGINELDDIVIEICNAQIQWYLDLGHTVLLY
jgi:hypothetical protein